jgi:Rieske Fe-S protein
MAANATGGEHPGTGNGAALRASRRQFTKWASFVGAAALAAGGFAVWRARGKKFPRMNIALGDEVPVGGTKIFTYPTDEEPCILLRPTSTTYVAYSRLCTHNACPVFFDDARNVVYCPCHGGVYSIADGSVLAGPPPRPLPRILLEHDGASIVATGVAKTKM